jgi:citrate synthase
MSKRKRLRSDIAWSDATKIVVRGHNLVDLIGNASLGEFAFLELTNRLPTPEESTVFDAIVVVLVEHGLTPSAIATRMTYLGSPEALQAAVAAGLLGIGDRFGGPAEEVAKMLQDAIIAGGDDINVMAADIVAEKRKANRPVPGLGHPIHRPADPRTKRLFEVAGDNGFSGRYVSLMNAISEEASHAFGRALPVNATGAIGAIASELGFEWRVCRGLAVIARSIGLVAHILEEDREPLASEIWSRVDEEATEHMRTETTDERD